MFSGLSVSDMFNYVLSYAIFVCSISVAVINNTIEILKIFQECLRMTMLDAKIEEKNTQIAALEAEITILQEQLRLSKCDIDERDQNLAGLENKIARRREIEGVACLCFLMVLIASVRVFAVKITENTQYMYELMR